MTQSIPELTIALTEYERNDLEKGDYIEFSARVASRGFIGLTRFWISRNDFDRYLESLASLDRALAGSAVLVAGWGDLELIRFQLMPFGKTGRLHANVELQDDGSPEGQCHRVITGFVLLPQALTSFRSELVTLVRSQSLGEARLAGESVADI
jgi:hypothetical protein